MNPEITLDDYEKIGTMETALSEHADEAFFELSEKGQKIAEKIFKCLTETDRENRETRRAMTVENLCAVAEADFAEVAAVIEVFRGEGRTFLMPPPEVPLHENSLIDISHESLIRKWERLKNWVEEEGQSSRTYRRLAEDALLHQQEKVGFWSDPELKDALEWRENFKPNETWARLYKETGERQFRASFADSMKYLDASEIKRDEEIVAEKRQQKALRSYAAKLRWLVVGLLILFTASLGVAGYAFYLRADAVNLNKRLATEKNVTEVSLARLEESQSKLKLETDNKDKALEELEFKQHQLVEALKIEEAATKKAEDEKKRADEQTKLAELSELETQKALEKQKQLGAEAESAKNNAIEKQKEAEAALTEAKATWERVETNRQALVFLEQGELKQALPLFKQLLASYEDKTQTMSPESRTDGKWWALHNLGIVNSKLPNTFLHRFRDAECSYLKALNVLGERLDVSQCPETQSTESQNSSPHFYRVVSYQTDDEITHNKVTTLRRLAQLYHARAEDVATDVEWRKFLLLAIEKYNRLIKIQETASLNKEQPDYMVDVYVELAGCLSASPEPGDYEKANKRYETSARIYKERNEYDKQVEVLRKWADAAMSQQDGKLAFDKLEEAISIQEDVLQLSPVNTEIENSYDQLARARELTAEAEEYEDLRYAELFELIRDVNYAANKTDFLDPGKVKELAAAYIKIGKCRRAEKLYLYAIDRSNQQSRQGKILRESYHYLSFYAELAELYHNVLSEDSNAKIYFKKFADSENGKLNEISRIDKKLFERAGDFYFAVGDYEQASRFYEYTLQKIEESILSSENFPVEIKGQITELILHKAEVTVKTARLSEAQNKPEDAEEKYKQAVGLATARLRAITPSAALIILRGRALIQQADFYERRGNKEKVKGISGEINNILIELEKHDNPAKQSLTAEAEQQALKVAAYKKLGDFNRADPTLAGEFYRKAISALEESRIFAPRQLDTSDFKDDKLSAEYYYNLAEIYESWMSLNGVELSGEQKKEAKNARKKSDEFKLEEQKISCRENK
jgi:tetratricopeptide (TPR) repeat protein